MSARPIVSLLPWRSLIPRSEIYPVIWNVRARRARRPRATAPTLLPFLNCSSPAIHLKPAFQATCRSAIEALSRDTADNGPAVLIGSPWVEGDKLYNAYTLLAHGRIEAMRFKVNLPNYGVFDEKRVFAAGPMPGPVNYRGVRIGLPICEDTWTGWGDNDNVD